MELFCVSFSFHISSKLLVCARCNQADRVLVEEDHDFVTEYSGSLSWQTDDVLDMRVGNETVEVYELYGEAHA
jgi:hypothetical protein